MRAILPSLLQRGRRGWRVTVALAAPVAAAAVITASAPGLFHLRVRPGDTLWTLAARYHTTVSRLVALNHLPGNGNLIYAGQTLLVPVAGPAPARPAAPAWHSYRVVAGDSVDAIAARFHVPVSQIAARNHLSGAMTVYIGQTLQLPAPAPARPTAPAWHSYRVVAGDSVDAIAARFHVPVSQIAARNHLSGAMTVYIGQTLQLPAPPAAAVPAGPDRAAVRRMLVAAAHTFGVDPALVLAVSWQESGWNQSEVSASRAIGVMQVEPYTGRFVGRYLLHRPLDLARAGDNIDAGVAMLALLTREAPTATAVAGYYQGLASVRTRGMLAQTKHYVADVLALRRRFAGS